MLLREMLVKLSSGWTVLKTLPRSPRAMRVWGEERRSLRTNPLLALLPLAAPAGAVLPPPSEGLPPEDSLVAESRGGGAPERPSRIYTVQGPELKARLSTAPFH